jgi:hypothetical protein
MVSRLRAWNFLLGDDLARGGFRPEDAQAAHAVGQEDHRQGQKSHAAQQVRLAAPEQQPVGHHFDVRQDRGAAGGVAGHHLEKGVGERRDGPWIMNGRALSAETTTQPKAAMKMPSLIPRSWCFPEKPPQGPPKVRINAAEIKRGRKSPSPYINAQIRAGSWKCP